VGEDNISQWMGIVFHGGSDVVLDPVIWRRSVGADGMSSDDKMRHQLTYFRHDENG